MALVSTHWLSENRRNVKIIDSSWHLPNKLRNGYFEYSKEHIPRAIYFDIDKYSEQNSNLPHMLPTKERWEKIMSTIGISNKDKVVVYDNSEVLSSCRLWYSFLYFGHNKNLIFVLDGGLDKWKKDNNPITNKINLVNKTNYKAVENKAMVKNLSQIKENIILENFKVIDGRSKDRFEGKVKEPREGLKKGSITNSVCLPYNSVINKDKTFKNKKELKDIFDNITEDICKNNIVFSCGSGITSCVLALAYSLINNNYKPTIYDGSWAEYGIIKNEKNN